MQEEERSSYGRRMSGGTRFFLPTRVPTSGSWQCGCTGVSVGKMPKYSWRDESSLLTLPAGRMHLGFIEFGYSNPSYHLLSHDVEPSPEGVWGFLLFKAMQPEACYFLVVCL